MIENTSQKVVYKPYYYYYYYYITSDRGGAFISNLWTNLALLLGIQLHHTTAYHPQSNGMIERWHRTLKTSLMSRCTGSDWIHHLPWVLLGLRTTPKEGINISAAEMVFGQPLVVPGEFFPCYTNPTDPTHTDLQAARWAARQFTPCLPTHPTHRDTYIPQIPTINGLRVCKTGSSETGTLTPL